ncbi:MAG: hypothetical protein AAGJ79_14610 [Verrucomicrobiota bacterium]
MKESARRRFMSGALLLIALVLGLGAMQVLEQDRLGIGVLATDEGEGAPNSDGAIEEVSSAGDVMPPLPPKNKIIANVESWKFSGESAHGVEPGILKDLLLAQGAALMEGEWQLAAVLRIEEAESLRRGAEGMEQMAVEGRENRILENGETLSIGNRIDLVVSPGGKEVIELKWSDEAELCRNGHTAVVIERSADERAFFLHLIEATLTR